jgi:tyrosinase
MLEQTLYRQMRNVAARFGRSSKLTEREKQDYVEAVRQFRLPYWDYYRPRGSSIEIPGVVEDGRTISPYNYRAPLVFTLPRIMVKALPDNEPRAIKNPLFQWEFLEADLSADEWKASQLDVSTQSRPDHGLSRYCRSGSSTP